MSQIKEIPDRDEVAASLTTSWQLDAVKAHHWAKFLHGLPWRYINPIIQIAINAHHDHLALDPGRAAPASPCTAPTTTAARTET